MFFSSICPLNTEECSPFTTFHYLLVAGLGIPLALGTPVLISFISPDTLYEISGWIGRKATVSTRYEAMAVGMVGTIAVAWATIKITLKLLFCRRCR